mmetsp:Transcript_19898/g.60362  ORF Transcript_19898/g.60362 Transcript_19898/m.60362 type:complete len:218 (-) Transcript_19898:1746-2399(-)|eukprot:scaffold192790_cov29-Tisochrysis_lutea.AAC.2
MVKTRRCNRWKCPNDVVEALLGRPMTCERATTAQYLNLGVGGRSAFCADRSVVSLDAAPFPPKKQTNPRRRHPEGRRHHPQLCLAALLANHPRLRHLCQNQTRQSARSAIWRDAQRGIIVLNSPFLSHVILAAHPPRCEYHLSTPTLPDPDMYGARARPIALPLPSIPRPHLSSRHRSRGPSCASRRETAHPPGPPPTRLLEGPIRLGTPNRLSAPA